MTKVVFKTEQYEFSHGKKPRGTGCWAFFMDDESSPVFFNGPFGEAKKEAVAWAKKHGFTFVSVGP